MCSAMRFLRRWAIVVLWAVWALSGPAFALDPTVSLNQFKHSRWTFDEGAPADIYALAQTPDGFLWIGSNAGLHRFDGVRFEPMPAPGSDPSRDISVSALMVARNGDLWIGYQSGRVAIRRQGRLIDVSPPGSERWIFGFFEDQAGVVWTSTGTQGRLLMRYAKGQWANIDPSWGVTGATSSLVAQGRDGAIWLPERAQLLMLPRDARLFRPTPIAMASAPRADNFGLATDRTGRVWLSSAFSGTRRLPEIVRGEEEPPAPRVIPPRAATHSYRRFLFDRDGAIWGATFSSGIYRIANPQALHSGGAPVEEVFTAENGLSSNSAQAILEDREGNIWVGTSAGLDRFRHANVRKETGVPLHSRFGYLLMGSRDGSIYAADSDSAYRIAPGAQARKLLDGLDNPQALCETHDGSVWLATRSALYRGRGARFAQMPQPPKRPSVLDCLASRDGKLWFSAVSGGLFGYDKGAWIDVLGTKDGRQPIVAVMAAAPEGGVLAYLRAKALVRIDPPRVDTVWKFADIPGGEITVLHRLGERVLVASISGLARYANGRITPLRGEYPWLKGISGIVDSGNHVWLIGRAGIARLAMRDLERGFDDPRHTLHPEIFTFADGLLAPATVGYATNAAGRGGDGRLWFMTTDGIAQIDPARLLRNRAAPPVHITGLTFEGRRLRDPAATTLPAGASRVEIDYTALSLSIPERVRFSYRLEGADTGWAEPGPGRKAVYTNLAPGTYRFTVIAANNDGVWNREGATLEFTIPPTFVQSIWFKLLVALLLGALAWALYLLRLRQVTARLQGRFDIRIAERERIARELHDTLLQGFQGLMLRFQAVANRIPSDGGLRKSIDDALDQADAVLREGRARVRELRGQPDGDLGQALLDAASAMIGSEGPCLHLTVEGKQRPLYSIVREEIQRICEEAIRNALRHADASTIEVLLGYGARELRLAVRDDGIGMPEAILLTGERSGHFGLIGMRERIERIGGRLSVASREGGGTEVAVTLSARAAYKRQRLLPRSRIGGLLFRKEVS